MADGQESFSVPFEKLNGSNWEEWSRKLKAWLVAKGLWEATQGPPQQAAAGAAAAVVAAAQASQRKDQKALGTIVLSLEGSQLPLVEGLETAQEAYQALERVHHRTTAGAKIHTTRSLFELKLRPGDSIRQHVTKMLSVFNKLRLLQVNFTEELEVYILLSSLDKSYDNLCLTLESMNPADLTLQYVTGRLCDEEERCLREGRAGAGCPAGNRGGGASQKAQFRLFPLVVVLSAGLLTICVGPVRGELERPGRMSPRSLPMAVSQVLVAASQVSMAASLGEEASVGMQKEDVTEDVRRTVLIT
ncbi:Hypothetical predicted protein [Podarcis lilfordi]|uniref:DUF4219 domain-containing protein n=1 Tax=Podarcis lilfordi TaxID=74358 RepID=A0AA35LNV8_9SAUR|nr:Hypothetical predicted protein [Podarcis lilfordi]